MTTDQKIRLAAFNWLSEQTRIYGYVLPRTLLAQGFVFEGNRIPLVSPQGIFTPKHMELPLTITTAPNRPYPDSLKPDGFLHYKYRGIDPNHRDNRGLREAMRRHVPLIYLHGIERNQYDPVWPVYIVDDDPANLTFKAAADAFESVTAEYETGDYSGQVNDVNTDIRRKYITTQYRHRVHQHIFRARVLTAYHNQCTFCRLRHPELLDAAHIIGDKEPEGEPVVNNGLALCKIHHAAFDELFVGVSPDYEIVVREDVRKEEDGPMLQHGLQSLHQHKIILPRNNMNWPDKDKLAVKFEQFRNAV